VGILRDAHEALHENLQRWRDLTAGPQARSPSGSTPPLRRRGWPGKPDEVTVSRPASVTLKGEPLASWKYPALHADYLRTIQSVTTTSAASSIYLDRNSLSKNASSSTRANQGFLSGDQDLFDQAFMSRSRFGCRFLIRWPGVITAVRRAMRSG